MAKLIVGVIGALPGGFAFHLVGPAAYGLLGQLIVATVGAVLLLSSNRLLSEAARMAQLVRAHAAAARSDGSVISLVIANLLAIAIARYYDMSIRDLMFIYWLQSVIIGIGHAIRMLCLKDYSKVGYNGRYGHPLNTSHLTKVNFAFQFVFMWGFAHLIILFILLIAALDVDKRFGEELAGPGILPLGELLACGLAFAADQVYSTARKIKLDRQGRPRVVAMVTAPFVRVLPIVATLFLGLPFLAGGGEFASAGGAFWWLFVGLKTVADVVMHVRDERTIQEALVEKCEMDAWKGDAAAQLKLGKMYLEGRGVPQDKAEALKLFRKAAEQANPDAKV